MSRAIVVLIALTCVPSVAVAQVAAKKAPAKVEGEYGLLGGQWHGALELRHHVATYYDERGGYSRRDPTVHARLQFGALFYDGLVDVYATLGVYKRSETRQFLQRRPELAADLKIVRHENFDLLQYNLVHAPFKVTDDDPEALEQERSEGTVYTFGLAPVAKIPFMAGTTRITPKLGLDAWTRFYSRKQYTGHYDDPLTEENEGHFSLSDERAETAPDAATDGDIEDSSPHYDLQAMSGVQVAPGALPGIKGELSGHYHSAFRPQYVRYASGVESHYAVDRYSFYRVRLEYELTPTLTFANDFYGYYGGMYDGAARGDDRRYRNVARLSAKL